MSLDVMKDVSILQDKYFFHVPHAHLIADYVWPGLIMSPQRVIDLRKEEFTEDDVLIASYPKSGTTWMTEIVSALHYGGDTDALKKVRQDERVPWLELEHSYWWVKMFYEYHKHEAEQCKARPRRVAFTHLPLEMLPDSVLFGKCKVVYVARNPKDNAVSFYHFHRMARFLGLQKNLNWNDFFALYVSGSIYCGSWFEHVLGYWKFSQKLKDRVLFCKYEDLKRDMKGEIDKIADFIDMKKNPMANRNSRMLLDQTVVKFMRKGQVGDWKNYFTFAQSELFDELYKLKMEGTGLTFEFEQ
ncbi:unnamed protein product [Bursaphelenchus xylophilus]|uniref:(pine wood nematode) hypothetical protein n=1 Tax=Bursaphelenchus xylophilus TaxID=6326 RepID=A0A7I8X1G0_BURXY|nr:unnamed protein product [Bursaphelenchus xylophilus]CAG9130455.1 unnamed protein product [Bursaphelenchus xylophilus]